MPVRVAARREEGATQHLLIPQVHGVHAGPQAPELVGRQRHHSEELLPEAGQGLHRVALHGHPLLKCL